KLVMTAECEAAGLYREGPQSTEFHRTVSRLIEMRTRDYLGAQHRADQ
ncbi:cell division protein ZapE, partial [bacterium]